MTKIFVMTMLHDCGHDCDCDYEYCYVYCYLYIAMTIRSYSYTDLFAFRTHGGHVFCWGSAPSHLGQSVPCEKEH